MHEEGSPVRNDEVEDPRRPTRAQALRRLAAIYRQADEAYNVLFDQRYADPSAVDQLDSARVVRDSTKQQWDEKRREFEKLPVANRPIWIISGMMHYRHKLLASMYSP